VLDPTVSFPRGRRPVIGYGVVAASQPLAAQAGVRILAAGGSAADAVVATAAMLTVVHPTNNGLGGDAFALVAEPGGDVVALDASGRSPATLDAKKFDGAPMPWLGWDTVTVPGMVGGWGALASRYGRLGFDRLLAPAVDYATRGWPVGAATAAEWASAPSDFADFPDFGAAFLRGGRAPNAGDIFRLEGQGETMRRLADNGPADFYSGRTAELIADHAAANGAPLSGADLRSFAAKWQRPISVDYHGAVIHQVGPPTQGIATLMALGVLARRSDYDPSDAASSLHLEAEAMKAALQVLHAEVADPAWMRCTVADLLSDVRLNALADRIDVARARTEQFGPSRTGGTVYVAAADTDGLVVSFIQSCYFGFGSGIVVPRAGISLHNRGAGFTTEPDHPNQVAPAKKPFHTIMPGLAIDQGGARTTAFGLVGGPMQPQGNLQLVTAIIDRQQNPQAAVDQPRWRVEEGCGLGLEPGIAEEVVEDLARRGHRLLDASGLLGGFGAGQIVQRIENVAVGGTDARKDGQVAAC
jgi:gamma-glutamyltranspeptidase / glutathione hydrolase